MEKIRGLSIRKTLFLFVGIAVIIAQLLYMSALSFIDNTMLNYMDPKPDAFVYKGGNLVAINYGPAPSEGVDITDINAYDTLKTLRTISPILIYGLCLVISIAVFYHLKLKKPLKILNTSVQKISKKELDFQISNTSNDELGRLCIAFENMRYELSSTFQALWKSEENQRSMYRAFAHDLRTPLTIIKGNNDIIELVAYKNNDWNQATQSARISNDAIKRVERYADQIKALESIDDLIINSKNTILIDFVDSYRQQAEMLASTMSKQVQIHYDNNADINIDTDMILRVLDNLLCNGLEYSNEAVIIFFEYKNNKLNISINDDGNGFSDEALLHAFNPFFSTNKSGNHMGIGLTISFRLIDKLNGTLTIENNSLGGLVNISLPV